MHSRISHTLKTLSITLFIILLTVSLGYSKSDDVDKLIRELGDEIDIISISAANRLGELGEKRATKALVQLSFSQNQNVSQAAVDALKKISDPKATELLIRMLAGVHGKARIGTISILNEISPKWYETESGKKVVSRITAYIKANSESPEIAGSVETLGAIGDQGTVDALISILNSKSRWSVISALESIDDPRAIEPVIAMSEPSSNDRALAISLFGHFAKLGNARAKDELVKAMQTDDAENKMRAAFKLASIGYEPALGGVIEIFLQQKPIYDINSVIALFEKSFPGWREKSSYKETVSKLNSVLEDKNPGSRIFAAERLLTIGESERAVNTLADILDGKDPKLKLMAVQALGRSKNKSAVEPLIKATADNDPYIRGFAATGLRNIADPRAVKPLIKLLQDSDMNIQYTAVIALGALKDARAVEPLLPMLEFNDRRVRGAVVGALESINDKRAVKPLIAHLKKNQDVSITIKALGSLGDDHAIEAIIAYLYVKNERPRIEAYKALAKIDPKWRSSKPAEFTLSKMRLTPRDNNADTRRIGAWALGRLNDKSSVNALIGLLGDEDAGVRKEVIRALWRLDDKWMARDEFKDILIKLRAALKEPPGSPASLRAIGGLAAIGKPAIEPLRTAMKDELPDVRANAVLALGAIGDKKSMQLVAASLDDGSPVVKDAALQALATMKNIDDPGMVDKLISLLRIDRHKERAGRALMSMGRRAIAPLIKALNGGDESLKSYTVMLLALLTGDMPADVNTAIADSFIKVLPKVKTDGQRMIINYLSKIDDPRLIEAVGSIIDDVDHRLIREIVYTFGDSDDPRALGLLRKALPRTKKQLKKIANEKIKALEAKALARKAKGSPESLTEDEKVQYYDYLTEKVIKNIAVAQSAYNARWETYTKDPKMITAMDRAGIPPSDKNIEWLIERASQTEFSAKAVSTGGSGVTFTVDQTGEVSKNP